MLRKEYDFEIDRDLQPKYNNNIMLIQRYCFSYFWKIILCPLPINYDFNNPDYLKYYEIKSKGNIRLLYNFLRLMVNNYNIF